MIEYRPFRQEDLFEIMKMVTRELQHDYNPEVYLNLHEAWPEGFIVATYFRRIVGFIASGITQDRAARIFLLVVRTDFQSRGIGRDLMRQILQKTRLKRIHILRLEVRVENAKAIGFYRNLGLEILARVPAFYKNGGDAYIMGKTLSS